MPRKEPKRHHCECCGEFTRDVDYDRHLNQWLCNKDWANHYSYERLRTVGFPSRTLNAAFATGA